MVYRDQHKPAICRSSMVRTVVQMMIQTSPSFFDGSDFVQIGDGIASWRGTNLLLYIELIQSIDCIPSFVNSTFLATADWVCNSEYCQQAFQSATGNLSILQTTLTSPLNLPQSSGMLSDPERSKSNIWKLKIEEKGTAKIFLNLNGFIWLMYWVNMLFWKILSQLTHLRHWQK